MKRAVCFVIFSLLVACEKIYPIVVSQNSCRVDTPILNAEISSSTELAVGGWAFDKQLGVVPESVKVQIVSNDRNVSKTFDAKRGFKRPDVARAFNLPAAESSGFNAVVPANTFSPGSYEVFILQDAPKATLVCGNSHVIKIK